ncbi:MAG TPA: hypothetical protein VGF69_01800 [Thermoanaerobaculia bacterium]|jgi:hypothetical protein
MSNVATLASSQSEALNRRTTVAVELPEFVVRALQHRVEVTNEGATPDEVVTLNDVIEWYLVSPLSVKELPSLETAVPGFSGALAKWIFTSTYRPEEGE